MYSAAFDDSGHPDDPQAKYVLAGGCVADVAQWTHLEGEWRDALKPLGVEVFHRAEFDGGTEEGRQTLMRLAGIVKRRVERSVVMVIPLRDYEAINRNFLLSEFVGFPYPIAVRFCIGEVNEWARYHGIEQPIEFVIEKGSKHETQLDWIANRDGLPDLIRRSKSFVPLQVADLVASEVNQHISEHGISGSALASSEWFDEIKRTLGIEKGWACIDPDILRKIFNVPERDPELRYRCIIPKLGGKPTAIVQYWPKKLGANPKLKKRLPQQPSKEPMLTRELMRARLGRSEP